LGVVPNLAPPDEFGSGLAVGPLNLHAGIGKPREHSTARGTGPTHRVAAILAGRRLVARREFFLRRGLVDAIGESTDITGPGIHAASPASNVAERGQVRQVGVLTVDHQEPSNLV